MYLMAFDVEWWTSSDTWIGILLAAVGLGFVIFVHELGHFAVAKLCGVKCEKFYIGFDIFGWKLCKFQWGETEYGIGALPLGGYVKMLGQEDNPHRVAEELEKARIREASGEAPAGSEAPFKLDPRSYMAQSVPERMAIISAGVIMNVIFAFVFASVAYGMGVKYSPCVVGSLTAGDVAWKSGLLPGDLITQIGDLKNPRYQDLQNEVALGDVEDGVKLLVKRAGVSEPISIVVKPQRLGDDIAPRIGVRSAVSLVLDGKRPTVAGSSAGAAAAGWTGGVVGKEFQWRIVAIDGQPVADYADFVRRMARNVDREATVKLAKEAVAKDAKSNELPEGPPLETYELLVAPTPLRTLGLVMKMGPLVAVQPGSPAETAGLKAGDVIRSVDGQPAGDPVTLPDRLRRLAPKAVSIVVDRPPAGPQLSKPNQEPEYVSTEIKDVPLREVDWYETPIMDGEPMSATALGAAYRIENVIDAVEPGSPAEKAGLKAGGKVTAAKVVQPEGFDPKKSMIDEQEIKIGFTSTEPNWPTFAANVVPWVAEGSKISLTIEGVKEPATMEAVASTEYFRPERGFALTSVFFTRTAENVGEAMSLGKGATVESLGLVVRFLQKLTSNQISPMGLGGPGSIFDAASSHAINGFPQLLLFLCMLSANLAVVNFLPIPVLDGGHMVFLAYEGVRGKPMSERVFMTFTYIGFAFIMTLMVFTLSIDFWRYLLKDLF